MKKHTIAMVPALLCALLGGAPALADSDGYYCAGPGYLAYQFNGISVPDDGHVVRIAYLDGAGRIARPVEVPLDRFQVHGMKCAREAIEIRGHDRVVTVDISSRTHPVRTDRVEQAPDEGFVQTNLGDWSARGVTRLDAGDPDLLYELVIEKSEDDQVGVIYHRTKTELVCKTKTGKIVDRMSLYEGIAEETVD